MSFINKTQELFYKIVPKRGFYDTELHLDDARLARAEQIIEDAAEVQNYLRQCYQLLRQGAQCTQVEVPLCLEDVDELKAELPVGLLAEPVTEASSNEGLPEPSNETAPSSTMNQPTE